MKQNRSKALSSNLTLPCAVGSIDVVEATNSALDLEVLVVVFAQLLRGQLLQTIGILRLHVKDQVKLVKGPARDFQ